MDNIYFLRIICKKKNICLYPETVSRNRPSLEAKKLYEENLQIFKMNDKTIMELGCRKMWRNMQIEEVVIHRAWRLSLI